MEYIVEVKKIRQETYDVKTFRLERPEEFDFKPGQSVIIEFSDHRRLKDEKRAFTISSSPSKNYLELTIKKKGIFTTELHENFKEGEKLKVSGPYGEFYFTPDIKSDLVMLSGGCGVTPFISILRFVSEKKLKNKIILIYSSRTRKDILFEKELGSIERDNKNIKVVYSLTREEPKGWKGEIGRISKEVILKYLDPKEKLFYLCGPPVMTDDLAKLLLEIGVKEKDIKRTVW